MQLNLKPHEYKRVNDGSRAILTRVMPYIVLAHGTEGGSIRVFIQNGAFFHEGGAEYKKSELPIWLNAEIAKLSLDARKDVGLQDWTPPESEDD